MKIPDNVIKAIEGERDYCALMHGPPGEKAPVRTLDEWILYMQKYVLDAMIQTVKGDEKDALDTVRKIASMATICMQQHGVQNR